MLKSLFLKNFRNFEVAEFDLDAPSTVFLGSNGKGKTSLLESIYFISTLRSFRTSRSRELRRIGTKGFEIRLTVSRKERWNCELKVEDGTFVFFSAAKVCNGVEEPELSVEEPESGPDHAEHIRGGSGGNRIVYCAGTSGISETAGRESAACTFGDPS